MAGSLARCALARGRTADHSTAVFWLQARREQLLSRGFEEGFEGSATIAPAQASRERGGREFPRCASRANVRARLSLSLSPWLRAAVLGGSLLMLGAAGVVSCPTAQARSARHEAPPDTSVGVVAAATLDPQARQTLQRIERGGPFPYAQDGIVFGNYEHRLPPKRRGYYREYTVPTPGSRTRGARRIVCGGAARKPDVCYYTHDHYASFQSIAR